jgi:NAD(P)-dependent dehydrogenase (short-subunit alcohol dehydrogenase family)
MTNTAIVTGASQGIGKATALKLARQGYNVVLAARQLDRLEAAASEIRALGREAIAISTDVRDPAQVNTLVENAIDQFGSVDVLVNDAAIYTQGAVEEFQLSAWQNVINTNIWGYIHTINALLPHFITRKSGTIVNVCSIGGIDPIPYQVPYTTSKYAVTGLTKSLHAELAPKGIHVCGIYPSFIRTSLMERGIFRGKTDAIAQSHYELVDKALHSRLLETPEDVAEAIWQGVKHRRSDVIVGTAKFWTTMFHVFPGIMQPMIRQVFGQGDQRSESFKK